MRAFAIAFLYAFALLAGPVQADEPTCKSMAIVMPELQALAVSVEGSFDRLEGAQAAMFLAIWNASEPPSNDTAISVVLVTSPRAGVTYFSFEKPCGLLDEVHKMPMSVWMKLRKSILGTES